MAQLDGPDIINGSNGADVIWSWGGNDTVNGRGGDDTICLGEGNDIGYGGDGRDLIRGGLGNDKLFGGGGNDRICGGPGNDNMNGGNGDDKIAGDAGTDQVKYAKATQGVTVDLVAQTATGQGNDVLRSIEKAVGSPFDDVIDGSSAANFLKGLEGDDELDGKAGRLIYRGYDIHDLAANATFMEVAYLLLHRFTDRGE